MQRQTPRVLYQDADLLVLAKPAGVMMHGIKANSQQGTARRKGEEQTLADWISTHYPETKSVGDEPTTRPGMVHRLDKDTSGVVLVARTQTAFAYLKKLFQTHAIKKTYLALVAGRVAGEQGSIEKPIGLTSGTVRRTVHRLERAKMVKQASTGYRVLERFGEGAAATTLLEVRPATGVTHQIRVHLASIGHPVVGDALYGGATQRQIAHKLGLTRQFLHAQSIELVTPSGERLQVSEDLPSELVEGLNRARPVPADHHSRS